MQGQMDSSSQNVGIVIAIVKRVQSASVCRGQKRCKKRIDLQKSAQKVSLAGPIERKEGGNRHIFRHGEK